MMSGFVARLDEINALADRSPGFVWRLQTSAGNATYLRPYGDDRLLLNMSVWETIDSLKQYVYRSAHAELLRQRHDWFEKFADAYAALWWIPIAHLPASTRRRSASPIWMSMDQLNLHSRLRPSFSRMSSRQSFTY